jgi:hypothetical protein
MNGELDRNLARRLANAHIGFLLFLIFAIFVTASDLRAQVAGATMSGTVGSGGEKTGICGCYVPDWLPGFEYGTV